MSKHNKEMKQSLEKGKKLIRVMKTDIWKIDCDSYLNEKWCESLMIDDDVVSYAVMTQMMSATPPRQIESRWTVWSVLRDEVMSPRILHQLIKSPGSISLHEHVM